MNKKIIQKDPKKYDVEKEHKAGQDTGNNDLIIDKYYVGDKSKTNYDGFFKIYVYHSDGLIRRELSKGYLFDKVILIALWNVTPTNGTFIDVGSNIGTIVVPMAKRAKQCYAFEPQKPIRLLLRKNKLANNVENIQIIKKAVGHYNGYANLDFRIIDHHGNEQKLEYTGTKKIDYGGVRLGIGGPKIKIMTIDSMKLTNLSSMKVDVEGAEPLVFYGAQETIKKFKPYIAFEKNYQILKSDSMDALKLTPEILNFDIIKFVESIGYKCILEIKLDNFMLFPSDIPNTNDPYFKYIPTNSFLNDKFTYTTLKKYRMLKPKWE